MFKKAYLYIGWNWQAFSIGISIDRESVSLDLTFLWLRLEW